MRLRLLADDLTGALDTAAQFVARTGPVPAFWAGALPDAPPPSAALDGGTRELAPDRAAAAAADLAAALAPAALAPGPGAVAYLKLDSLLRGHAGVELAAVLRRLPVRRCVVAPAFPFQGRVTRGGRQHARGAGGEWQPVGEDLRATLARHGMVVAPARPGDPVPEGVSLWDAETDADLAAVAAAGRALGEAVLWCGSGGLAGALAGAPRPVSGVLARPVLGLFGSDHPATAAQLCAAGSHVLRLADGGRAAAEAVTRRLVGEGVALVAVEVPMGLSRPEAAARIAREMDALTRRLAPPRTLVAAGGETLRALCLALGAGHLEVYGHVVPGVPRAVLRGGRWDGTEVVSKSGAFGEAGLLARLLSHGAPQPQEGPSA